MKTRLLMILAGLLFILSGPAFAIDRPSGGTSSGGAPGGAAGGGLSGNYPNPSVTGAVTALSSQKTVNASCTGTINVTFGAQQTYICSSMAGNVTIALQPASPALAANSVAPIQFEFCQPSSGGPWTATFTAPSGSVMNYQATGGGSSTAPTLSTAASACDWEFYQWDKTGGVVYELAPPTMNTPPSYAATGTLAAHNFVNADTSTGPTGAQPACSDLTGAAASCGTNATELTSGTVASTRGGVAIKSGPVYVNNATTTTVNELVEFSFADAANPARVQTFNGTTAGHLTPIGVCDGANCGGAAGTNPNVIHHGPHLCDFDGATTAGDIVVPSTTSAAHTCHDSGVAEGGAVTGLPLGIVKATIGGVGTAMVNFDIALPMAISQYGKCIVGSNKTVTHQTGTPPAQNLWTTLCSVTFPPLPVDPGWGNAEFRVTPGNVAVTTGGTVPTDLVLEISVLSSCVGGGGLTQTDPHGYGTAYLATFAPNTSYQHIPVPAPWGALFEGSTSDNPISCGAVASIKAVTAAQDITILASANGPAGLADDGTQFAIVEAPLMGVGN